VQLLAVLNAWDRRRAQAWAHGDTDALALLYAPGSLTGARDVHDLRRWVRRGVRVTGMREQVRAAHVRRHGPRAFTVVVTDRLVGAVAHTGSRQVGLPVSRWATHRIRWHRTGPRWVVVEAAPFGRQAAR
jgi:hypothetical protein